MQVTYQSKNYSPDQVVKRYVRKASGADNYNWCEVGKDRRYDLRQGTVEADELTDDIRALADEQYKTSCHYINWPLLP